MTDKKLLTDHEARKVLEQIDALYPDAKSALHWDNIFHLLCAVIMSAQTTDKMVNRIMLKFAKDFPRPLDLAQAKISKIEEDIKQIGLYHTKAAHLKQSAEILVYDFNSKVPNNKNKLMTLPGVGEKTANVVLAEGYQIPAIAVDTHISRITKCFHIVPPEATPHQIEKRLEALLPKQKWIHTHHALILFGRNRLTARKKNVNPYSLLK